MAESNYCDDYYEYMNDDCDGDCDNCNHKDCDEHPHNNMCCDFEEKNR